MPTTTSQSSPGWPRSTGERHHLGLVAGLDPVEHHRRVEPAGIEQQDAADLLGVGLVGGDAGCVRAIRGHRRRKSLRQTAAAPARRPLGNDWRACGASCTSSRSHWSPPACRARGRRPDAGLEGAAVHDLRLDPAGQGRGSAERPRGPLPDGRGPRGDGERGDGRGAGEDPRRPLRERGRDRQGDRPDRDPGDRPRRSSSSKEPTPPACRRAPGTTRAPTIPTPAEPGDGSAFPGQGETIGIAGHRTTYLAPFRRLDELEQGDEVTLEMPYATFTYRSRRPTSSTVADRGGRERGLRAAGADRLPPAVQRRAAVSRGFAKLTDVSLQGTGTGRPSTGR